MGHFVTLTAPVCCRIIGYRVACGIPGLAWATVHTRSHHWLSQQALVLTKKLELTIFTLKLRKIATSYKWRNLTF